MNKLFTFLLLVVFVAFTGCKRDNIPTPAGKLTCKIDNTPWAAAYLEAVIENGKIIITGKSVNGSQVSITLLGDIAATYNIGADNNEGSLQYYEAGTDSRWASHNDGTYNGYAICTVAEINTTNKTISGTFACSVFRFAGSSATNTKIVTDGVFINIPYTETGFKDSFSGKFNGVSLVPTTLSAELYSDQIILRASDSGHTNTINIVVPKSITPGTYTVGTLFDNVYGGYTFGTVYWVSNLGSGQIVITSHNTTTKHIAGTFNFTVSDYDIPNNPFIPITEGSFDMAYYY